MPATWEVEESAGVQVILRLSSEFEASLGYTRPCLKQKTQRGSWRSTVTEHSSSGAPSGRKPRAKSGASEQPQPAGLCLHDVEDPSLMRSKARWLHADPSPGLSPSTPTCGEPAGKRHTGHVLRCGGRTAPRSGPILAACRVTGHSPGWVHETICCSFLNVCLFLWGWGTQHTLALYEGQRRRAQTAPLSPCGFWGSTQAIRLGQATHGAVMSCGSDNTL